MPFCAELTRSRRRGRPAVVTICQNANGSQIVTLLLTNAPGDHKEMLIEAIRRHGVTLKGSKHGSRIWFVVERARGEGLRNRL